MSAGYSFAYELTPEMADDAAEDYLESMKAGRPDRRMRGGMIGFGFLFVQVAIMLFVSINLDMELWLIVAVAILTVIFGLCTLLYAIVVFGYPVSRRRIERAIWQAFEELDTKRVRWTLTGDKFHVEPAQRDHVWSEVREAYVGRKFWILHLESELRLLLPVSALPEGAERFMLDRLTNAGAAMRIEKPND